MYLIAFKEVGIADVMFSVRSELWNIKQRDRCCSWFTRSVNIAADDPPYVAVEIVQPGEVGSLNDLAVSAVAESKTLNVSSSTLDRITLWISPFPLCPVLPQGGILYD